MATVDWSILAQGQVANSQGVIFTASEQTWIKSARFFQTSATPQDVTVWIKKSGGTAREVAHAEDMPQNYALEAADEPIVLDTGDTIEAATTTAAVVNYTIMGGTRVP
jgi:hypothetical protein